MYAPVRNTHAPRLLLYPLHLSMVGIFAFVLPFICWGALATPGHPHGLPHFVFASPLLLHAGNTAGDHTAHASYATASPESASNAADEPAAQSVIPVLGVALLAPILFHLASLVAPALRHNARRQSDTTYLSLAMPPVSPPPRHTPAAYC